jgi:FkbM family methyltransferase
MARSFADTIGCPVPRIRIVDIGAMSEGEDRYHPLIATGLAEVTGFEPNRAEYARLAGRAGAYRYLPVFLGNGERATFHITNYPGCSSLLEPDPATISLFQTLGCDPGDNFHVVRSEPVETRRLDDLGIAADYLKLDVQGSELDILRHGTATLAETGVIETEVEFVPLYKEQPLFGDIQCFLREQGFVLHKLIDVSGRPFKPFVPKNPWMPISQLLWADAIFVRDFSRLDAYTSDSLLRAAAILDMVYRSYDLAALLLAEHDKRHQHGLQQRYFQSLKARDLSLRLLNIVEFPAGISAADLPAS